MAVIGCGTCEINEQMPAKPEDKPRQCSPLLLVIALIATLTRLRFRPGCLASRKRHGLESKCVSGLVQAIICVKI